MKDEDVKLKVAEPDSTISDATQLQDNVSFTASTQYWPIDWLIVGVAPDTDLAGYPANNFAGNPAKN